MAENTLHPPAKNMHWRRQGPQAELATHQPRTTILQTTGEADARNHYCKTCRLPARLGL